MTLVPAYGRDYKSGKEAKAAFAENKDFQIADHFSSDDGRVCNREDLLKTHKGQSVNIRFKKLTGVCVVKVA